MKNQYQSKYLYYLLCILLIPISSYTQNEGKWHIYEMDGPSLNETRVYVDTPTIGGETYITNNASTLKASPYDRLLFVVDGSGTATVISETMGLKTGDIVFLKADDTLTFSGGLTTMLWTSKSTKTNHTDQTEKFAIAEIETERDALENVWNPFIETSTMVAGLYMLPETLKGDDTLTHGFDEINYVVHGTAKFKINDTEIDVKPGSIMWVKRGVGHSFYDLSDDFDVFILFETINMNHDH